ncbi:MAG: hypothetical protein E7623_01120 [Ruminococcaceae bacterium]|nr:hypothetical protein [Oscillospiraceae bacterium]
MRNVNIDRLRVLAIFGIVAIHAIGKSGALSLVSYLSPQWFALKLASTACYPMMNVFILISAFFLCDAEIKVKKIRRIIFLAGGYSVSIYLVLVALNLADFSAITFIECVLSIFTKQYWYVGVYLTLYIISPYLNKMLSSLDEKDVRNLCIISFFIVSVLPSVLVFKHVQDLYDPSNGKGILWFLTLYLVVYYVKKYKYEKIKGIKNIYFLGAYILGVLVLFASAITFGTISIYIGMNGDGEGRMYFDSSVPMFISSLSLFLLAIKKDSKQDDKGRIAKMLSVTSLGIYLIHEHPVLRRVLWEGIYNLLEKKDDTEILMYTGLTIVFVFFVCTVIELSRSIGLKVIKDKIVRHTCMNKRLL